MRARLALSTLLLAALSACGSGSLGEDAGSGSTASQADPSSAAEHAGEYAATSDVTSHAAIGQDVAKVKDLLAVAKDGTPVDWASVSDVWTRGGASKKSDGSMRTLAKLVDDAETTALVADAIAGVGTAQGAPDAIRAQYVDKGISVLLAAKVRDELASAREKVIKHETDVKGGAPHNVDEAWAFYDAEGSGLASTAEKRAADFGLEGKVHEPVLAALTDAQRAATAGDLAAFDAAATEVGHALNAVFYLATYKYLDAEGDAVRTAEGSTFYRGIAGTVRAADKAADATIVAAFAKADAAAGRAALNAPAVFTALGVAADLRVA